LEKRLAPTEHAGNAKVMEMMMQRCHGCDDPLTSDNDSEAHIIPKALGGRLAPKGLICRKCNTALDAAADNALIEAFGAWPTLLAIPRQGGGNPPKVIQTREGQKVRVEPDGSMTNIDVVYGITPIPGGHKVQIAAGDMKTVRQLLKRAANQFPQFDPVLAEQYARTVGMSPDSEIQMSLDFSPRAVFGGAITAIWLILLKETGHAIMNWDELLACISKIQTDGGTFRYLVDGLPGLRGPQIDIGHKLIVRSVPSTGELIAYVEILGVLKVGGVFAKSPNPGYELQHIYAYDVAQKSERTGEFSIDPTEFDRQDWRTIGLGPTDASALKAHFLDALGVFVAHYQRRFSSKAQPEVS